MKIVPVEEAVGQILGHDLTEIIPGLHKISAFKKGHTVTAEDIPRLLRMGKTRLRVLSDIPAGLIHEDEAAVRLARALAGENLRAGGPSEGRADIHAVARGLLTVDTDLLAAVNDIEDVTVATLGPRRLVEAGQAVAGARVVPLCVREEAVLGAEALLRARGPLLRLIPLMERRIGLIVTGREVASGLVEDAFTPILRRKFEDLGSRIAFTAIVPDETADIAAALREALKTCDLAAAAGGMSVDPDDLTPAAIREVCGETTVRGVPVFPGAMFMLGYSGDRPVLGVPGCVMRYRATVLDLVLPRLLAGQRLTRRDFTSLGAGGFCPRCPVCHFPDCSFGRA